MKIVIVNAHIQDQIGGSELQCHMIGRELAEQGHEVHYLAVGGSSISSALPYHFHPLPKDGRQIGKKCVCLRPDIVYWRFNKRCFLAAARIISAAKIPLVFCVSHVADTEKWSAKIKLQDATVRQALSLIRAKLAARLNHFGYRYVHGVIVNNPEHLGLLPVQNQIHIDNSIDPALYGSGRDIRWGKPYCLWVGNLKPQKQPEVFVRLAQAVGGSGIDFLMIGRLQSERYGWLEDPGKWPDGFRYLGPQDVSSTHSFINGSLFLVHTCKPEGFPNVFIQAWACRKPVVSLSYDPGGLIRSEALGYHSETFKQLARDVTTLISDASARQRIGNNAIQIVGARFCLASNVETLSNFLQSTIRMARRAG